MSASSSIRARRHPRSLLAAGLACALLGAAAGTGQAAVAPAAVHPAAATDAATAEVAAADGQGGNLLAPPMGWSSWSSLREDFTATTIEAEATAMHNTLEKYGYQYVNIDAGWSDNIDAYGRDAASTSKFPDGIQAVAQYVHKLGLKLGIYLVPGIPAAALAANSPIAGTPYHVQDILDSSAPGNTANQGAGKIDFSKPGAQQYIQSQANLLASWGVDYIKMDFVGPGGGNVAADNTGDIEAWHEAIARTGRPMHLELSNSLSFADASTWAKYSNGWRIEGDIECYHSCTDLTDWSQVAKRFTDAPKWVPFAGPGHWNDLDSLEVGNGTEDGLTQDEKQTMVTLWSIEAAPLLLGTDLTKLDPTDLPLITNREVIAVDQSGRAAKPVSQATPQQVWFSKNPDGSYTVALFNLATTAAPVTVNWSDLGRPSGSTMALRDLWQHTNLGHVTGSYTATLAPHASMLLHVTPTGDGH
jgi:hypothetical protein